MLTGIMDQDASHDHTGIAGSPNPQVMYSSCEESGLVFSNTLKLLINIRKKLSY